MIRYSDNRNFFRMMVNTEMTLTIRQSDSERVLSAVCIDLSATGMAIEIDEPIEAGTELTCCVEAGNNELNALKAAARVIRCQQVDSGMYMLGVEITEHL